MKKPYTGPIPFRKDNDGTSMMEYTVIDYEDWSHKPDSPWNGGYFWPTQWRKNYKFDATIEYQYCRKGRSAMRFYFRDIATGERFSMALAEFDDQVKNLKNGRLTGTWTFKKQGSNYSLVSA